MSAQDFHAKHAEQLDHAVTAIDAREYWSPFPETPSKSVYGEEAAPAGEAAFQALLGRDYPLDQPGVIDHVGTETSPFGLELGIRYPRSEPAELIAAAKAGITAWRDAGPALRAGVAMEVLHRINARSFEFAHAVQHTTGQAFVMAFQAGGPHAQDRALEAIAYAYAEQARQPRSARWAKPQRKGDPLVMDKTFTVVPRGVSLVIACNTFPTWNTYPGLFASLVTGNPVIVKPHPGAVLPLALTVTIAREVLTEAGFDPNLVTLAVEAPGQPIAAELATHPDVRIVDFTGSTEFGDWLEGNARQAVVYTEKAGLNTVVVDSTDDYKGLLRNLSFSLSLYSGQMCTTPQNILLPGGGVRTEDGTRSPEEFAADLGAALDKLLGDPARAAGTLGAIVNEGVKQRLAEAENLGAVAHASTPVEDPAYPGATIRTPLVVRLDAKDEETYTKEWFGPISFVISTDSTEHALEIFRSSVRAKGALTASVYSTDAAVIDAARAAALDAGVHLSENLTGGVFVNQSAAFSDFHGTGANPAATAALTDPAYVTGRFHIVQSRRHAPA
ncbi:phenylacetic acid degradation protein PaaN [Crossiella sp. CA-258035]|uniref:phenylacetic acid degradation protein PaaN n=1 Tax=Crossiella sp. CA-258035 TaxID=2981138 RepID=UPI0024BD03D5|nr:phenylacetic acid degradation protein PaaN [Crossiella sp. CA-258035]WHT22486.1 phenylacetic acid degradation protein PaaN [Crossiella sp. CA-258035]